MHPHQNKTEYILMHKHSRECVLVCVCVWWVRGPEEKTRKTRSLSVLSADADAQFPIIVNIFKSCLPEEDSVNPAYCFLHQSVLS